MSDAHETGQIEDALSVLEDMTRHSVSLALISASHVCQSTVYTVFW